MKTPSLINEFRVVRVTPDLIKPGYLLHDGIVLSVDVTYSSVNGEPTFYEFETPHTYITAEPTDIVLAYGRITEPMLEQLTAALDAANQQLSAALDDAANR